MNFWRWVQAGLVADDNCGVEFENDRNVFYANREKFNLLCQAQEYWSREGALLFYYLNRTCFNGLCRFNRKGYFNVPFGSYKTINYKTDFTPYVEVMKGWEVWMGDFGTIPLKPTDFIYADPPYDDGFTSFAQRDFNWDDQVRLARWLAQHPGPSVASNLATDRIVDLYENLGFTITKLEVPRRISCNGDRTPALEMLARKGC
jgi:DNA adenine methylase